MTLARPLFLFLWILVLHFTLLIPLCFLIVSKKKFSVILALSWLGLNLICLVEPSLFVFVITLPLQILYPLESLKAQFLAHFSSLFTLHPWRISPQLVQSTNDSMLMTLRFSLPHLLRISLASSPISRIVCLRFIPGSASMVLL
jgi:hypothetical protein